MIAHCKVQLVVFCIEVPYHSPNKRYLPCLWDKFYIGLVLSNQQTTLLERFYLAKALFRMAVSTASKLGKRQNQYFQYALGRQFINTNCRINIFSLLMKNSLILKKNKNIYIKYIYNIYAHNKKCM
jgi:hypothetical protein